MSNKPIIYRWAVLSSDNPDIDSPIYEEALFADIDEAVEDISSSNIVTKHKLRRLIKQSMRLNTGLIITIDEDTELFMQFIKV